MAVRDDATAEHGDADDIKDQIERQAFTLGRVAWHFATNLRQRYALGATHLERNFAAFFDAEAARFLAVDKANRVRSEEMWAAAEAHAADAPRS